MTATTAPALDLVDVARVTAAVELIKIATFASVLEESVPSSTEAERAQ
ncbi:hypothetical protein SAMN05421837_1189 [Amycolatopsis pretoriensis]|uniref:Uncharacterized protein n=1 Tax=Amycolatopsis pretoriensis TaxID=218821 RepID=A0A1H5RK41_9PSEU|nr:hypothetical protein [Amycolatopsis pretoriensis]SEF38058.1 hypothetical protein SAMN05421837_1189 [Amycolatopsis pretoriensis]